ncbi:hypothetical protein ACTG9Q_12920 [Actinokineospora sp. 24-640]
MFERQIEQDGGPSNVVTEEVIKTLIGAVFGGSPDESEDSADNRALPHSRPWWRRAWQFGRGR